MTDHRNIAIVGGIIFAIAGAICGTAVVATFVVGFDGGANIGAGILLLAGLPFAIVGGALLIVAGALRALTRRRRAASVSS